MTITVEEIPKGTTIKEGGGGKEVRERETETEMEGEIAKMAKDHKIVTRQEETEI